jgi:hypothetical protein
MASVAGVQHAVPTHPVSASGIRLSSRPVSGHLGSSSRGSGARPSAVHPSSRLLSTRAVSSRLVSAPVRPDASVSHAQAVAVGTRSRWPGDPDHRNRWRPLWLPSRRRLDRRSRRPGRGRRCRRRVGQWEVGGGPGPPSWVRAAAAALAHRATRQARPALGAPLAGGGAVGTGAGGSARWLHPPRGCRPRLGARPRWVVVAEPDGRGGGPGGAT